MPLPSINRLSQCAWFVSRYAWFVLYVAISWQLMSCHTTKQTTEDNVQLRSTQLHDISTHDINLDIFDICQWDILDSAGQPTGSIVQNRHTKAKIHAADTTQATTNDTTQNHKSKTTIRNTSALPAISENDYNIVLIICACVMLIAIIRICKI